MKNKLIALTFALAVTCHSQTNSMLVTNSVLVTNWITGDFLRLVDGKVYDNRSEGRFVNLPHNSNNRLRATHRIDTTSFLCVEEEAMPKLDSRFIGPDTTVYHGRPQIYEQMIILNAPEALLRTARPDMRVMAVARKIYLKNSYPTYDFGIHYTNAVQIITRRKVIVSH